MKINPTKALQNNDLKEIKAQKEHEGYLFLKIEDLSNSIKDGIDKLHYASNVDNGLLSKLEKYVDLVFPPQVRVRK